MWDAEKFHLCIKKKAELSKSKQIDVVKEIAKNIHVSEHTVISWTRLDSNGPNDENIAAELAEIFGIPFSRQPNYVIKTPAKLSETSRRAIVDCCMKILDYLDVDHDPVIEGDQEELEKLKKDVNRYEIVIPGAAYKGIKDFINQKIEPLVCRPTEMIENEEQLDVEATKYYAELYDLANEFKEYIRLNLSSLIIDADF